jgi:acyl-CoA thioester hydrolase
VDPIGPRQQFRFALPLRVRFIETDAQGVVHHTSFFAYAEAARHEYWERLGVSRFVMAQEGVDDTMVEAQARYRAPARFYDRLEIHLRTAALGRTSFVCEFLVTRGGAESVIAELRTAHVMVDLRTRLPVPIPEFFRRAVVEFEGPHVRVKRQQ